jgi:hypothetical protein
MASSNTNTKLTKKRHSFFSHYFSTKNLSIFRNKSSKHYQSQIDINSQQTQIPICISRAWSKRHLQRPSSFDLDHFKNFLINNNEHFIEQQPKLLQKQCGTIID